MHRWLVSCLRMRKRKLSALCPLVPFSSANGGAQLLGGTMHAMPHLQHATATRHGWNRALYCYFIEECCRSACHSACIVGAPTHEWHCALNLHLVQRTHTHALCRKTFTKAA